MNKLREIGYKQTFHVKKHESPINFYFDTIKKTVSAFDRNICSKCKGKMFIEP